MSYEIRTAIAAPNGWRACFDLRDGSFGTLPIVAWGIVFRGEQPRVLEALVAGTRGDIVPVTEAETEEREFFCLVGPGEDPAKVIEAILDQDEDEEPTPAN